MRTKIAAQTSKGYKSCFLILVSGLLLLSNLLPATTVKAQQHSKLHYLYLQWGYNREIYSKSNIHFYKEGSYDFVLKNVSANDKPDFEAIYYSPSDISIPQYNFRLGAFTNEEKTKGWELNFDHTKYVVRHGQRVQVEGSFYGHTLPHDTVISPAFVTFEHTDGANFLSLYSVHARPLYKRKKFNRLLALGKVGGGIVIPRTDVTIRNTRLNNRFHVAGFQLSGEWSFRYYPLKNLFLELAGKVGYAMYINALTIDGGKAKHSFFFLESIGLLGYDLHWSKRSK